MPVLLPPEVGESILGDPVNTDFDASDNLLQETGRTSTIVDINDATKVVSSLTLALGIVFLVTTAVLYGYYYSTTFDFTDLKVARSLSVNKVGLPAYSSDADSAYSFLPILEDLESSLVRWGVSSQVEEGCRRKIVCEALLSKSRSNPDNSEIIETISNIMNSAIDVEDSWKGGETKERHRVKEFLRAAKSGLKNDSCESYSAYCPTLTLHSLTVPPK